MAERLRFVSQVEADVIRAALARCPTPEFSDALLATIDSLEVVGRCSCGCDTVDFRGLDWSEPPTLVADGVGTIAGGHDVGILIFANAQRVVCLEVYGFDDRPARLPAPQLIRAYEVAGD